MEQAKQSMYLKALHKGVSTATGCTEPVAVAFAVATCAEQLNHEEPKQIDVKVSANIMKMQLQLLYQEQVNQVCQLLLRLVTYMGMLPRE